MRKTQLRKIRFRHQRIMQLRKVADQLTTITDSNGHQITLNIVKHLMMNKPYKNQEYQRELIRRAQEGLK
jgi:endonuclease/exonuclease/phosphatase (EEP) superfamily protein YafD